MSCKPLFNLKQILFIALCIFLALNILAQEGYTVSKKIFRIEDGLSSNNVVTAAQDNNGFMWFGTSYGLNKYDGHKFKVFTQSKDQLNSNSIEKLAIDDANRLWIVSGGVLQIMNLFTNEIQNISDVIQLPFEQNQIVEIANNGSKEIQVLTKSPYRLWYYSSLTGFVMRQDFPELNALGNVGVHCCFQNSQTAITFSGYSKLFLIGRNKIYTWNISEFQDRPIQILDENEVILLRTDASKRTKVTSEILRFTPNNTQPDFLPNPWKAIDISWPQGSLIEGKIASSSSLSHMELGLLIKLNHDFINVFTPLELEEFNGSTVYGMYSKDSKNFWIWTTSGIVHARIQKKMFSTFFNRHNIKAWEGQSRGIYVSNFNLETGGGKGEFLANVWGTFCSLNNGSLKLINHGSLLFALDKIDGEYFVGSANLFRLNKKLNRFEQLDTLKSSEVWSVFRGDENVILTGRGDGIFAYHRNTKETTEVQGINSNWPNPINVYRFAQSKSKGLVAVAENGLFVMNSKFEIIDYFGKDAFDEGHRIPVARIYDWHEDSNGVCWLASGGEGLLSWKWLANGGIDQSQIRFFTMSNGLPSTILYRIEEDNFSNLWISTYNGLVRFSLKQNEIKIFTTFEGISHNEFNRVSSFKDEQGRMYFGGMNGVNVFDPKNFLNETNEIYPLSVLAITKFSRQLNAEMSCIESYNEEGRITMHSVDLFLKIDFAFLSYYHVDRGFEFMVEGAKNQWEELVGTTLQIGALPPGEYTIRIRARRPDGTWNPQEIRIPLTVKPPFYLTAWFLISSFVIVVFSLGGIYKLRTIRQRRRLAKLEIQILNRTTELQSAVNDKEILLKEVHHRVKNNLQVISGLLQLQKNEVKDESLIRVLSEGQSRLGSIALIHKNIYQNADLESVSLQSFITELFEEVKNLFNMKTVAVHGTFNMNELSLNLQNAVPLGLILNELMTNSFKHAVLPNKDLEIRVEMIARGENQFELIYQDNGPGLIRDAQSHVSESLGMRLIFGLTKQINGEVLFERKEGLCVNIRFSTEIS